MTPLARHPLTDLPLWHDPNGQQDRHEVLKDQTHMRKSMPNREQQQKDFKGKKTSSVKMKVAKRDGVEGRGAGPYLNVGAHLGTLFV